MTVDRAPRKIMACCSKHLQDSLRWLVAGPLIATLATASGCAYRTTEEPTGQTRYEWTDYSMYKDSLGPTITARGESEEYLVLTVAEEIRLWKEVEDQYIMSQWDGPHDLDECAEMSALSLGTVWVLDTAMWLIQLGFNDTICYAQLWAPDRRTYYDNGRRSDTHMDYLLPSTHYPRTVLYDGRPIGETQFFNNVMIFPKSSIPGDYNLRKIRFVNDSIELAPN